ncbi:Holliday junction resolvase RuvX [Synechocystis sp. CACIAM 05]|uniref:Holliday junction resolvase RuvX n=1 Tax=Synechocystis sp. CACIAM 05 TaxID=1933929 RepID=UPI00138E6113|nr:Holliday junction resolvase RuvX [Synechocystis sp. CACIAM 05]QHV01478.1 Holliday junction resolvase RuvX [Synechocystis sp. CACIAM 05]
MSKKVAALGLDVGRKRIGVAGCDGTGLIATGITTIVRSSYDQDIAQIKQLVEERNVNLLVVGLPYTMAGEIGSQAKQVQKFARRLAEQLNLPLEYMDERLSSVEAENQLKAQKRFSSYNKGLIDQQAAQIILQQWLDLRRANLQDNDDNFIE